MPIHYDNEHFDLAIANLLAKMLNVGEAAGICRKCLLAGLLDTLVHAIATNFDDIDVSNIVSEALEDAAGYDKSVSLDRNRDPMH